MLSWAVTDRVTRLVFYGCLVLAAAALTPILAGEVSLPLMVVVLVLVYQAWRLAMTREVRVQLDGTGITKTIGTRSLRLAWEQVTGLRTERFLGTDQLVLRTTDAVAWSASDKLFTKLDRTEVAVQVPQAVLPQLRQLVVDLGMAIA